MPNDIFKISKISRQKAFKQAYNIILDGIDEQLKGYLALLKISNNKSDSLVNRAITEKDTYKWLEDVYLTIMPDFAKRTFEAVEGGRIKADWSNTAFNIWLRSWIKDATAEKVKDITDTTRERIKNQLSEAAEGLSIPDLANNIRDNLAGINKRRATMIARTEVISSSNAASLHGALISDVEVQKIWIPAMDSRVRDVHAGMRSHEPIDLTEDFTVNGEKLSYPGDLKGSASNVINCRCTIGYVRK